MPTCKKHNNITGSGVDDSFLCVYCEIDRLRSELAAKEVELGEQSKDYAKRHQGYHAEINRLLDRADGLTEELEQVKREKVTYKSQWEAVKEMEQQERKRADDLQREMDKLSDKNVWSLAETIVNLERKLFDSEQRADDNEKALKLACDMMENKRHFRYPELWVEHSPDYFRNKVRKAQEGK